MDELYKLVEQDTGTPWRLIKAVFKTSKGIPITKTDWDTIKAVYGESVATYELTTYVVGHKLRSLKDTDPLEHEWWTKQLIAEIPHEIDPLKPDTWVKEVFEAYLDLYLNDRPPTKRLFINNHRLPFARSTIKGRKVWIHDADISPLHTLENCRHVNLIPYLVKINSRDYNFKRIRMTEGGDVFLWT